MRGERKMIKSGNSTGQVALIIVFGLGVLGVLLAVAFSRLAPQAVVRQQALADSSKAYFAAQSGIEELMLRLRSHHNFGDSWEMVYQLDNGAVFYATISGNLSTKIATSTGMFKTYVRKLEVQVAESDSKTSFLFAVQSGEGGFELERNTVIRGIGGAAGNVYTNGDILGENKTSGTSGSKILGQAWAVGKVSGLTGDTSGGVYIQSDAAANELVRCGIGGNALAPAAPGPGCEFEGDFTVAAPPEALSIESVDTEFWKQQAVQSSLWPGNCVIQSGGGVEDCSGADKRLGSVKIEGDLVVNSNSSFTLTGPVWVEGDLTINSNVDVYVDDALGSEGVVVVIDYPANQFSRGKVVVASNVDFFQTSEGGPAVLVTTNTEESCSGVPAVTAASNTTSVVFSAPSGCVFFESNSFVRGVLANAVHLSSNSVIEYDPRLAAVILTTGLGGWQVIGFTELVE
ncbi:MAG: protein of unknown function with transmembrane region [Candidatus Beckwithbacteria bacterium GW2011_GWC1_49_16]|nr:MAG: protein of unknown function with transmembrane region [Candidatus Beckwithbacteria bacterium GW2011_GWC1_49_16]